MDGYGNIEFLGEGEIGIDRRIAGEMPSYWRPISPITLKPPKVKSFRKSSRGTRWPGGTRSERMCPDDPGGCGVLPFLDALWLAENNGCDVETLHLGENIFHILARCGGVECRRALLFHPTGRVFLSFRIEAVNFEVLGHMGAMPGKFASMAWT